MTLRAAGRLLRETGKEWQRDRVSSLAAALSYYTIFSLAPMLVVIIGIAGMVFGPDAAGGKVRDELEAVVGADAASVIQAAIRSAWQPWESLLATAAGVVSFLLGATMAFGELQRALNAVWEVQAKSRGLLGTVRTRFISFAMVLVIGLLLLVSLLLSAALSAVHGFVHDLWAPLAPIVRFVDFVTSLAMTTALFALIFKILPDVHIAWRYVWVGAAMTALLFSFGRWAIGVYLGTSAVASAYGAAGALAALLLWIYYSAHILLLGAEFTEVFARYRGAPVVPARGARWGPTHQDALL